MRSQKVILISVFIAFVLSVSLVVYVSAVAPTVSLVSPTPVNNSFQSLTYITVNVSSNQTILNSSNTYIAIVNQTGGAITNRSGVEGVRIVNVVQNYSWYNFTGFGNGTFEIAFQVNASSDSGGTLPNFSVFSRQYNETIDTAVPTATINTTMGFNSSDTTPELDLHLVDNVNTSITYRLYINDANDSTYTTATNSTTFKVNITTALANGTARIRLEGIDSVGRANSSEINITIDTSIPNMTLTQSKTKVDLNSINDIDCNAADSHTGVNTSTISLTITKPSGKKVTSGAGVYKLGNVAGETDEVGTYSVSCTASDFIFNNGTSTITFTTQAPSSGGTTTTTTAAKTLASETVKPTVAVKPDAPFEVTVTSTVTSKSGLDKLTIEVNSEVAAADATVGVKALDKVPAKDDKGQTVTALSADQPSYKVMQFAPSAALSTAIKVAKISFTLTEAEQTAAGLTASQVVLLRFADGKWNELETKSLGNGKFEATTPGFSVFVVSKKADVAPSPTATTSPGASPDASPTAPGASPTATTTPTAPKAGSQDIWLYTGIAVAVIVIIVALALTMRRKK